MNYLNVQLKKAHDAETSEEVLEPLNNLYIFVNYISKAREGLPKTDKINPARDVIFYTLLDAEMYAQDCYDEAQYIYDDLRDQEKDDEDYGSYGEQVMWQYRSSVL